MSIAETHVTHAGPGSGAARTLDTMKALVYHGPGKCAWEAKLRPTVTDAADAIVRITTSTICGTDLHILKGDLPSVTDGRILGHEGIGIVESIGPSVTSFRVGDRVLISCVTACGKCDFCRKSILPPLPERWLDPGQHDRRHAGGIRAHPPRGHEPLSRPGRRR